MPSLSSEMQYEINRLKKSRQDEITKIKIKEIEKWQDEVEELETQAEEFIKENHELKKQLDLYESLNCDD